MIFLSNINDKIISEYVNLASDNLFAVRVKGLLKAYGNYPHLCDVWYQHNEKKITAYIVRYGGDFIADIYNDADINEIVDLCKMAGGTKLLCKKLNLKSETGIIMKLSSILIQNNSDYSFSEDVNLQEYYGILKANQSSTFTVPNFEDFYVDLNHRLRKQAAKIIGCYQDGILVSCCVATAVCGASAVLAGVAALPNFRNKGYGTAIVVQMCKNLLSHDVQNIYLQRDKNENYNFYHAIGFKDIGEFCQINL